MRSLQRRIIVAGIVWAVVSTSVGAIALTSVFDQIADRRFNQILHERHMQVVVAFFNSQSPEALERLLPDPEYGRVYSGKYWQIVSDTGERYTSPSLFDTSIQTGQPEFNGAVLWEGEGPNGAVRGLKERVLREDGSSWTVSVASSLTGLAAERSEMRRSAAFAFGFVAFLGIAGAALLTSALVSPLRKLGDDVLHRWDTGKMLRAELYPQEVAPLVKDINELIAKNRDILDRGRRQAADLAHALKTPTAALRNQLLELNREYDAIAATETLDRIDAQITRSLARMRASTAKNAAFDRTDIADSVLRIERLFRSMPESVAIDFSVETRSVCVAVDAQDIEEILGNLLENAFKWCRTSVHLSVEFDGSMVRIVIEDDGPGIDAALRSSVLREGTRLDVSVPGTGLGLSITNDLVKAYGGSLQLLCSEDFGGLRCEVNIPRAGCNSDAQDCEFDFQPRSSRTVSLSTSKPEFFSF